MESRVWQTISFRAGSARLTIAELGGKNVKTNSANKGPARKWGPWTEAKLDALESYLQGFTRASASARRTLYLDLLSGSATNVHRQTGEPIRNSVERALATNPPFTRVVACELNTASAQDLRTKMGIQFPERDFVVLEGDCNIEIPSYLKRISVEDSGWRLAPSFAFVDQFSAEIWWDTLSEVAAFRRPNWKGVHRKTELWLLFGDSFIPRGLSGVDGDPNKPVNPAYAERIDRMYGTEQWREILCGRQRGLLSKSEWRLELVNLMRWRLERDLGYASTIPLAVPRGNGQVLYHMIFATDEKVGDRIMTHVLRNAGNALEQMKRDTKISQMNATTGLFDVEPDHLAAINRETSFSLHSPLPPWKLPITQPEPG